MADNAELSHSQQELAVNADQNFRFLADFWRDPTVTSAEFEAKLPETIGCLPENERGVFLSGVVKQGQAVRYVDFHDTSTITAEEMYLHSFFPNTWQLIQADLEKIGMKPSGYWATYSRDKLVDGEAPLYKYMHVDGDMDSYRKTSKKTASGEVSSQQFGKRLALYIVASKPGTEIYRGPASIRKTGPDRGHITVYPMGISEEDTTATEPEHIIPSEPFAIMRMDNLTLHRSPIFHADKAQSDELPYRTLMRLWCEEWVDLSTVHPIDDRSNETLSLQDLYNQLPTMNMTQHLGLVAIDPQGNEHRAKVAYSSDLHSFAIMQYDERGNIVSWIPLPTNKTHHSETGAQGEYVSQAWPDQKASRSDTKFRFV